MNTNVWLESGGNLLRESLRQEARRWHLLHQPPATKAAWDTYRRELRRRLHTVAGTFPEPVPLDVKEHGTLRQDGYRIIKLTYQSRPDVRVTANLYVPDGDGPFPAVLGTHGHWQQGKLASQVAARGHTLAKHGIATLIVDAFGAGERGTVPGKFEYHGQQIGSSLLLLGESLLGMQVYDNMRGIDLLQSLAYVDGRRIGVTGASGGGNQTMWLAAFDERITAAVPVVSVGTFESYITNPNCVCETLPDGLTFTEEWAVLALVAPNALLILNSLQDGPTFCVQEMLRSYNAAREVYRLHDAIEKIQYKAIDLPHGYWPEMRRHMLGWFRRWLKNEGEGWPCEIPTVPELPEPDLMCFPDAARPAEVKSVIEYVTLRARRQKRAMLRASAPMDAAATRAALRDRLRLPAPTIAPTAGPAVTATEDGLRTTRFAVATEPGVLLPCLLLEPKPRSGARQSATVTLMVHPDGKAALAGLPAVRRHLDRGDRVCLADLRHVGETRWNQAAICEHHDASRSALWLGRTMVGDWTHDLLALRQALAQATGASKVEVVAFGPTALSALAAAVLAKDIAAVATVGLPASFVLSGKMPTLGMSLFVPGILNWGDVTLMAALARCPVSVHAPVTLTGEPLKSAELRRWQDEVMAFARRLGSKPRIHVSPDAR